FLLLVVIAAFAVLISINKQIEPDIFNLSSVVLMFIAYLSLSLVVINFILNIIGLLIKYFKNTLFILVLIVLIMVFGEAMSSITFYKDGYYEFLEERFTQQINHISSDTDTDELYGLVANVRNADNSGEIPIEVFQLITTRLEEKLADVN